MQFLFDLELVVFEVEVFVGGKWLFLFLFGFIVIVCLGNIA